ncbi:S8 family peptidase [Vibrio sonorensis]|uniref:S8 family peptidase n=1 Tax=Vibrio sonorensis TaxID=1004316 RepID=UPI0008D9CEBB|nr:S8 family serine peptidase [Vibrio sonorensis]
MFNVQESGMINNGGSGVKVGIIDGAIDVKHKEFRGFTNIYQKYCGVYSDHGTAVCSIIKSKNFGLLNGASIYSYPVYKSGSSGNLNGCHLTDIGRAISSAINDQCDIINISGASVTNNTKGIQYIVSLATKAIKKNIFIISSVGNEAKVNQPMPASIPGILSVGSCDQKGKPSFYNNVINRGKLTYCCPGDNIKTAIVDDNYRFCTGTSFSTPIFSCLIGSIIYIFRTKGITYTHKDIIDMINNNSKSVIYRGRECKIVNFNILHQLIMNIGVKQ